METFLVNCLGIKVVSQIFWFFPFELLFVVILIAFTSYICGREESQKKFEGKPVDTLEEDCVYWVISKAFHPGPRKEHVVLTLLKNLGCGKTEVITLEIKQLLLKIAGKDFVHVSLIQEYFVVGVKEVTRPYLLLMDSCEEKWMDR